jgi:DNA ligase-1
MHLHTLVDASAAIAGVSSRLAKIAQLADLLARLAPDEVGIAVPFLVGRTRHDPLGIGPAAIAQAAAAAPAGGHAALTLHDVDDVLARLAEMRGSGSVGGKASLLRHLFERATQAEQRYLVHLLHGEPRQGALDGILAEAVAQAAHVAPAAVRRAVMLTGDLALVASAAMTAGEAGVTRFAIEVMRPVQPMLADSAADVADALRAISPAALEFKIDGARIQAHKDGDDVRVFSRHLRDVTPAVPEVVDAVRLMPVRTLILDGEVVALRGDGTPHPFQTTMRRFGRKLDVDRLREELPLSPFFFDLLYGDDTPLVDESRSRRFAALAEIAGPQLVVPQVIASRPVDAARFFEDALARGHEGIMVKALDAPYAAGSRGSAWLKVKAAHTLDLVVLAAEWGSGRRRGWLSNLHLGARDPAGSAFVMLGKTFKGLTDETLTWQTRQLLAREIARDALVVHVRPELVVEIAFNEIQVSPRYPGGLALRFARVKRYRSDKTAAEADTFATVQAIYRRTTGREPPVP